MSSAATTAAEYISTLEKISKADEKFYAITKLPEALKKVVVIYGIVTLIRPPTKSSTNVWSMALTINDPTLPPPKRGLQVMIFRPTPDDLPMTAKIGDLYKFKVYISEYEGRVQVQIPTHNTSVYARKITAEESRKSIEETHIFTNMKSWWKSLALGDDFGKPKEYAKGSEKVKMIKDAKPNQFIDLYCKILYKPKKERCQVLVVTDFTSHPKLKQDNTIVSKMLTPISTDCLIVASLWDNHSECPDLVENGYALLKNCRIKLDKNSRIEIAVNGDKVYPTKRQVFGLGTNDPGLQSLLSRERDYIPDPKRLEAYNEEVEALQAAQDEADMHRAEEQNYLSEIGQENHSNSPVFEPVLESKEERVTFASATPLLSRQVDSRENHKDSPPQKPAKVVYQPPTQIIEPEEETPQPPIDDDPSHLFTKISDMISNPQIPSKYRIQAKVIDHMPHDICNFTKSVCVTCRKSFQHSDKVGCPLCKSDKYPRSIYNFSLLLEDESGQVPLVLHGTPATKFLQLPPTRLTAEALDLVNEKLEKLFEKGDMLRVEKGYVREWVVESYNTVKGVRYRISEDQSPL